MHAVRTAPQGARLVGLALAMGAALTSSTAFAHAVVVDGDAADWSTRLPNGTNLGIVARDSSSTGEFVWFDARLDARTDLVSPESGADLQQFAVTADATNLYFRVVLGADASPIATAPQIQIAIDLDRVAGSGNTPFAGFADTDVAPAAAWERLVQTQGGPGGTVRVRDTAYAVVGTGTIARNATTNVTEIAIPWTLLPAGSAFDVLRFTVAIFRENAVGDTVDIMGSSDALDVMTDYGDPGLTANTFAEVMDGVVGYSVDVWLARADREPYAPLQIVRFMSDAPAAGVAPEWLEVRNQTPVALDLSTFAVGDEETPDGTEEMVRFPAGSTLASGAVAVIAGSAATFTTAYGSAPDYELLPSTAAGVPDMARVGVWSGAMTAGSALSLANTGDELVALGFNHTLVDVVTYGGVTYPGITSRTPVPGPNRIATRDPISRDTDNNTVDFPLVLEDCGPMAGTCASCRACTRFACVPDTGAACDDGDACTTGTICSATAGCGGGSAVSCDDMNGCTTDTCAAASGCAHTINTGALCDDGSACTSSDVCSAAGVCGGTAVSCDDMNGCTTDTCSAGSGCAHTPATGSSCSDGNPCTSTDACTAAGTCVGAPTVCMEDANPCTTAVCMVGTGCVLINNTAACDDGSACTSGDVCGGGTCAGTAVVCNDMNPCTSDACAATTGMCAFTPTAGASCNDGNACTSGDVCSASGSCAGTPSCDAGSAPADAAVATPDAYVPPADDAAVLPTDDAAVLPTDDAAVLPTDDAAVLPTDDAAVLPTDDAAVLPGTDAAVPPGTDGGSLDGGPATDAGRRDAGSGFDAGSGLPPSNTGSCSCRAAGTGTDDARGPLAGFALLMLLGLVVRRSKR